MIVNRDVLFCHFLILFRRLLFFFGKYNHGNKERGRGEGEASFFLRLISAAFFRFSCYFFLPVTNRDVQKGKQHEIWG